MIIRRQRTESLRVYITQSSVYVFTSNRLLNTCLQEKVPVRYSQLTFGLVSFLLDHTLGGGRGGEGKGSHSAGSF